jgi:anti-sigma regulatory factor (Ser/Thr protein kinase)
MEDATANHLEMILRGELSELERLAAAVEDFVARNGLPCDLAFRFNLCLDELVTNIVSHGYGDARGNEIRVRMEIEGQELRAEIEDDAGIFNPFIDAPPPDLKGDLESRRVGGLGVFLVGRMMDRTSHRHEGGRNLIQIAKRIG